MLPAYEHLIWKINALFAGKASTWDGAFNVIPDDDPRYNGELNPKLQSMEYHHVDFPVVLLRVAFRCRGVPRLEGLRYLVPLLIITRMHQ